MRRLIVDGYNVLRASPRYATLAERDLDAARARLVDDVASFAAGRYRATVVFDAGANPRSTGAPHGVAGVTVLFSKAGEDADTVIEGLVARARSRGDRAVVATSDAETQRVVAAMGAARMSSAELAREMDSAAEERSAYRASGSMRSRIEERLDPGLREKLFRWARGG